MASQLSNLVLLLLVTSSGVEPYPLAFVPQRHSPSSSVAHRLGPTVESNDPGTRPLMDGAVKWANQWSGQLPHKLFRSGGIPESEGPASLEGSAGGVGAAREGVSEVGVVVVVRGTSGPWGRPRGPMEICAVQCIVGAPTGSVTTVMQRVMSSSSSFSPPDDSMTRAHASVQPG
jgi:hypothetical protein